MKRTRTYSPHTLEAAQILGTEIARARRARRLTLTDLAERAGVTPVTLRKIERGDPTVGLGTAFEVAGLVGIPLFNVEPERLKDLASRSSERLTLLPQRVRDSDKPVHDDF